MAEGERSWPDDRRGDQLDAARRSADDGVTRWLRRAMAPRPREIWVMEPDGRMRKVLTSDG
jgi:hypothetical protein